MLWGEDENDLKLHECPVGYVLREAPHTYDTLELASSNEYLTPQQLDRMPRYMRAAIRIMRSENERLREAEKKPARSKSDVDYTARVLSGG